MLNVKNYTRQNNLIYILSKQILYIAWRVLRVFNFTNWTFYELSYV